MLACGCQSYQTSRSSQILDCPASLKIPVPFLGGILDEDGLARYHRSGSKHMGDIVVRLFLVDNVFASEAP